jgi:hypothetical protein
VTLPQARRDARASTAGRSLSTLSLLACLAATFVACGGGSSPGAGSPVTSPVSTAVPTFSPVPLASLAPFDLTQDAVVVPVPASTGPDGAPITIPLPSNAQVINEMDLSADGAQISPGTTVDTESSDETPTDAPAPTSRTRVTLEKAAKVHIETVAVKFSQKVVLKNRPTFVFTFAPGFLVANANYYLQMYDSSEPDLGWQDPFEGPATVNGNSLLLVDSSNKFTFEAGVKYRFDLYAVSSDSSPTPFPAPSGTGPAPTPTPASSPSPIFGLLTVTPGSFAFTEGGQTETLTVSEAGYAGAFTATVADPTLATVGQTIPGTFLVTATQNPGASAVVIKDNQGQTVRVQFTVTITTGTISGKLRYNAVR